MVRSWIVSSWRRLSADNVRSSILAAGFAPNFKDWHISKHDVYGEKFFSSAEVSLASLEQYSAEDDIETIDDGTQGLELDE